MHFGSSNSSLSKNKFYNFGQFDTKVFHFYGVEKKYFNLLWALDIFLYLMPEIY